MNNEHKLGGPGPHNEPRRAEGPKGPDHGPARPAHIHPHHHDHHKHDHQPHHHDHHHPHDPEHTCDCDHDHGPHEKEMYALKHWQGWGSWFSWGSPIGLGLFLICIGAFLLLLARAGIL